MDDDDARSFVKFDVGDRKREKERKATHVCVMQVMGDLIKVTPARFSF